MARPDDDRIREAARALAERGSAVALTGAGVSVDSGIPAFRGAQGMWGRYDPMEFATLEAFVRDPIKVWRMLSEMIAVLERAAPNPAHTGLAALERMGILRAVITQNVDGLHQAAGSRKVVEFHGNAWELLCLVCGKRYPSRVKVRAGIPPRCGCGEVLKPDVVFFGEPIPRDALEEAESEARACAVLLVVGTSAEVSPACDIPLLAKRDGAVVVEINPEETILTRRAVDLRIAAPASEAVPRLVAAVRGP